MGDRRNAVRFGGRAFCLASRRLSPTPLALTKPTLLFLEMPQLPGHRPLECHAAGVGSVVGSRIRSMEAFQKIGPSKFALLTPLARAGKLPCGRSKARPAFVSLVLPARSLQPSVLALHSCELRAWSLPTDNPSSTFTKHQGRETSERPRQH